MSSDVLVLGLNLGKKLRSKVIYMEGSASSYTLQTRCLSNSSISAFVVVFYVSKGQRCWHVGNFLWVGNHRIADEVAL